MFMLSWWQATDSLSSFIYNASLTPGILDIIDRLLGLETGKRSKIYARQYIMEIVHFNLPGKVRKRSLSLLPSGQ